MVAIRKNKLGWNQLISAKTVVSRRIERNQNRKQTKAIVMLFCIRKQRLVDAVDVPQDNGDFLNFA